MFSNVFDAESCFLAIIVSSLAGENVVAIQANLDLVERAFVGESLGRLPPPS